MFKSISDYFLSLNSSGQALFVVGILLVITFIVLLIVVLKPEKNKAKKVYGESAITDSENAFIEKIKNIDSIDENDINIANDKTRNLKRIVDELKGIETKPEIHNYESIIERYEDEQEDTAVISVEELLRARTVTYEPSKKDAVKEKTEVENLYFEERIIEQPRVEQPISAPVVEERKYKPTPEVFSSIYVENKRPEVKEEKKDNEAFLDSLKEFRNNL